MPLPATILEYRLPKVEGFHCLTLNEVPLPTLKATQVLVKVHAVSIQYRDLDVARNTYPMPQKENPVPGSDLAGEIVALGPEAAEAGKWRVGDRVCSNFAVDHIFGEVTEEEKATSLGAPSDGVLTEYKALPAHALVRIPEHLSYQEASTLPCAALTAYNALMGPNPLKGGDTVLVQGTGGVSIFGLQLAVASGASVIVTSSSDEKLKIAKSLGAAHLINYKTTPNWDDEVLRITNGKGVDHILEVGGNATILRSIRAARFGGVISSIGYVGGQADVSELLVKVINKAIIIRGILIGSRTRFEEMNRLIEAVKMRPVIDKVFAFRDLRQAYEYQASQKHVGKIVVQVSKD
ncbi:NAD-P-binding protein [Trametes polyzona]|nr:NAD-P-binding protein [Trametes polyzona]